MSLLLTNCTIESCGYIAAFISCLAFGSFAVPIKAEGARKVDMDPLVFQTYKTMMCFLSSFIVLLFGVEKLVFTPWGLVSGLFWIPAGMAYVCGVRTAGLAIAQATSSSAVVIVSFSWGMFIFNERVRSLPSATLAAIFMIGGICGMSFFTAPPSSTKLITFAGSKDAKLAIFCLPPSNFSNFFSHRSSPSSRRNNNNNNTDEDDDDDHTSDDADSSQNDPLLLPTTAKTTTTTTTSDNALLSDGGEIEKSFSSQYVSNRNTNNNNNNNSMNPMHSMEISGRGGGDEEQHNHQSLENEKMEPKRVGSSGAQAIVLALVIYLKNNYGIDLTVRQMGLFLTALGGLWGGSVMVPLHYAGEEVQGLNFVFSFAVGASIINILAWVLRFLYEWKRTNTLLNAYKSLPPFHIRLLGPYGATSGFLWSIGNVASILSVTYLGTGVGYSMTQSSMLISGLWGICYFREIQKPSAIRGWMASACLTIAGMLLLSYNHLPPKEEPVLKG